MNRETLQKEFDRLKKDERHLNSAETAYWCSQYKRFAQNLLDDLANLDMSTKQQNVNTSEERVQKSDKNVHEPVAWLVSDAQGRYATIRDPAPYGEEVYEPLFAKPPHKEWVSITDAGILETLKEADSETVRLPPGLKQFARAIEAKLKEKNA
jgi:hypothetical protein